ncbi:MAG: DegT/DnrJ/EryC1/StrS family aminotransferase [Anaerorhabdus sp.]
MSILNYGRQQITEDDEKAILEALKSDYLTQGPLISQFEKMVAKHHGAKYAVLFNSGTAALHSSFHALGVEKEDEVIVPAITFAASGNGAIYNGGKIVLADIDLNTSCIDIDNIDNYITDKTKVITPVSMGGYPVHLERLRGKVKDKDIKILYDAAHSISSKRDGSFGMEHIDIAILSFHPVKHITTGEGGMALTNDKEYYEEMLLFRNHGITKDPSFYDNKEPWYYEMISLGYHYRMPDLLASLGISQFKRIEENISRRNEIAEMYYSSLQGLDFLELPPIVDYDNKDTVHSYHLFQLKIDPQKRLRFYEYMRENKIMCQIHYVPMHFHKFYRDMFGYKQGDFEKAEEFYSKTISIPMYHDLKNEEVLYIIDTIKKFK